jgi:hypothetical protein
MHSNRSGELSYTARRRILITACPDGARRSLLNELWSIKIGLACTKIYRIVRDGKPAYLAEY